MQYFKSDALKASGAKSPAFPPGLGFKAMAAHSGRLQIAGGLLAPLRDNFEAHFLAFNQRTHSGALHRRDVHKHVFRAVIRLNEAVALLSIEEFYSSDRHQEFPFTLPVERPRCLALAVTSQVFGSSLEAQPKTGSVAAS
jgi:hypothetical protein